MTTLRGLSAFPITPMTPDGAIIDDDLAALVARIRGPASVGLLGSTGSYMFLTRAARARAIAVAREATDLPLIVGVGALRTDEAVALAQDAARGGADGLLLAPVCYNPLTRREVTQHYRSVAQATDVPLVIYSNPGTTQFSFDTDLLADLASVPQIAGVKLPLPPDPSQVGTLRDALPQGFVLGYSADQGCAAMAAAGADAWFSVVAGVLPEPTAQLAQAAFSGGAWQRENDRFAALWRLFETHGSLRIAYAIADALSLTSGVLPLPLLPVVPDVRAQVDAALEALL